MVWIAIPAALFSSCVNDAYLAQDPPVADQSFVEEFDNTLTAYNKGWRYVNRSEPIGPQGWIQGAAFPSYSSVVTSSGHVEQNYNACAGTTPEGGGVISNWLVSPPVIMQNGDKIIFYSRCSNPSFQDRLQVRMNKNNTSVDCGRGLDPGFFDVTLLDVNPFYAATGPNAFPNNWTRFEATVYGLQKPVQGRFGIRAFVEGGGPGATEKGSDIGIDSVAYISVK